ncbi:MAG TPA: sigma-54-dependent Fis family transcriptional regulator [Bacillales bacterium]|nr:sigma-54-dependent Fis family transcriptional regulator [Bacillales bacterium]
MKRKDPEFLTASWKRSQAFGVDPIHAENEVLTGGELKDREARFHELLQSCSDIFENLYAQLKSSLFMMLVSDVDGYIVFSKGEPPFLNRAKKVWLNSGANWSEQVKGTNAIGTALIERKPVHVVGNHHFCRENQFLVCYAAPLYSATGEMLGILDISGNAKLHHPHTFGMVRAAAEACQSRLLLRNLQQELTLSLRESETIANQNQNPLISIDPNGIITRINQKAARLLEKPASQCIGQPLSSWFGQQDTENILGLKKHGFAQIKMKADSKQWKVQPIQDKRRKHFRSVLSLQPAESVPTPSKKIKPGNMIWSCPKAEKILHLARRIAQTDTTILIRGETGTGKEIIAKEIHRASGRKGSLVTVNCGAIPEQLIESELFGYEKGAFTGAHQKGRMGKFEAADGGTLFLDEIGEMPTTLQIALLRVLEEKKVMPIGSNTAKPVDVRIITATHRDLIHDINENQFRADLYYRLCEIELPLPALRERTDLYELSDLFLSEMSRELNADIQMEQTAQQRMETYDWPGNIRELRHVLRQAAYLAYFTRKSTMIRNIDLHLPRKQPAEGGPEDTLHTNEEEQISGAIRQAKGNISRAADLLGMGRTTLYRKMKRYPKLNELKSQLRSSK